MVISFTQCLLRGRGDNREGFARIWKRLAKPGSLGINGTVAERMESIRAAGVDVGGWMESPGWGREMR